MYDVVRTVKETQLIFDNGVHEHYVNTVIDDGSSVAGLMQYFKKTDAADMSHGELSQRVKYLKEEDGGRFYMCEIIEKLQEESRNEGLEQGICALILDNIEDNKPKEVILSKLLKRFGLTEEEAEKYYNKCV